jgi:hypothetical protein
MLLEDTGLGPHGTFYFFGVISIVGGMVSRLRPAASGTKSQTQIPPTMEITPKK